MRIDVKRTGEDSASSPDTGGMGILATAMYDARGGFNESVIVVVRVDGSSWRVAVMM